MIFRLKKWLHLWIYVYYLSLSTTMRFRRVYVHTGNYHAEQMRLSSCWDFILFYRKYVRGTMIIIIMSDLL